MSWPSHILIFGARLLRREWPKYSLAFLSLFVTSVTFTVVIVGVDGARKYLEQRSQEFAGGDLTLESGTAIDAAAMVTDLRPYIAAEDREISLLLTVRNGSRVTGVSVRSVTEQFPLYGKVQIEGGEYRFPEPDEVYVERLVLDRLDLSVGDTLLIGAVGYRIRGVIVREPDALVQGFRFAPRLIFSEAGLARANIKLMESRNEYEYRYRFSSAVPAAAIRSVTEAAERSGIDARVAGDGRSGFLRRLENVERFFLITVLIGAVLSSVNVYANALALVTRLRRSLAIFLVEGVTKGSIVAMVLGIISAVTLIAATAGAILGLALVNWLYDWVRREAGITLVFKAAPSAFGLVVLGALATSLAAAFPALRDLLTLEPKSLLSGPVTDDTRRSRWAIVFMSLASFLPLFGLAVLFLGRIDQAGMVVGGTFAVFVSLASLISLGIRALYRSRQRFSFFFRTIIAEKYSDGIFGTIAATSLSIALASIFTLSLLGQSLQRFFDTGIGTTIPSGYIIDVQSDQLSTIERIAPGAVLYPNIRARIRRIDDRLIQERLRSEIPEEDRELGREFNLTYRTELISSESITLGTWYAGRTGEVSVEEEFADRVGIRLGSTIEFLIQGVPVTVVVSSLRKTDTTSGLPFFYFVLHPDDVRRFPASYFGYVDAEGDGLRTIERALSVEAPNVSVLDTSVLGATVREVTATVITLLSVITLPPLILATLLLFTLIASTFAGRRRDAVRLRILGATRGLTVRLYLVETLMTVLIVSASAILLAQGVVFALTEWVLEGVSPVFSDVKLLEITLGLGGMLLLYAFILMRTNERVLREALAYEENS